MSAWRLVCDAGGTNVRFARAQGIKLDRCRTYPVSSYRTFGEALEAYLGETGGAEGCGGVAIGAAGAVSGGAVRLTNADWEIVEAEIASGLGVPCAILNDVQAVAYSIPLLDGAAFEVLGDRPPNLAAATRLLTANIGTGFGAATLMKSSAGWVCCPSEAGHMSMNLSGWHDESIENRFPSVEHVLSGRGLCNLYSVIAKKPCIYDPANIIDQVRADLHCGETLRRFTQIVGDVLGNLALAVAAWDGVYLCGSVAKAFVSVADLTLLREAFEDKGPMSDRMRGIPIAFILHGKAALIGLAALDDGAFA